MEEMFIMGFFSQGFVAHIGRVGVKSLFLVF